MAESPKQAAERAKALQAIEASEKRIAALVQTATGASAAKLKTIELQIKAEETKQSLQEREISRLGTIKSMYDDIAGGLQSSVTLIKAADKAQDNMFKATVKVKDLEAEIVKNAKLLNNAKLDGRKSEVRALKLAQQKLKKDKAALKVLETSAEAMGSLRDELTNSVKGVQDFVGKLPGGEMMTKAFGLDKLGKGVEEGLTGAVKAFNKTGSLGAGVSAFSKSLLNALGPVALIAAAVAGLVMIFKDVSHKAHEISHNTGLTYAQSKNLVKESNKVLGSFDNQLSLQEDILAVVTETVNEFGVMGMMTTAQAGAISDIGIAFGYGAKQAGEVNNAFMRMGATADEAANTQRDLAAEAMKAGVSVGAVTKDIAENSKLTSKFFGGNVKALKKAAIEAAKMGVSLSTMAKVSDSLLNFEESISAQFELQALTGKNMNLDAARRLALEGDIAGATASVLDQVGSIAEFDKLGYLGRKKLAEATGMDVDELQKSMIIKEKMGNLDADQLATMTGLGLSAAKMADMSAQDLQDKLASKQASEKMAANFAALKATFVNALMPAAEGLMSIFSALSPLFKVLGSALNVAFMPITWAAKGMQTIFDLITSSLPAIATFLGTMTLITIQQKKGLLYEQGKAAVAAVTNTYGKIAIGLEKVKGNLQKKTLMKSMGDAAMSAWSSLAKVPVVGAVLGAVAAAGVIAMGMKYMNDGVISGSTGSSGYGSRTMFGPEGAISFNNKDTIVAGTDLFGKANDAMFAPKGAIKMNDGVMGDMPDPPEAKIVGIAGASVAKLSMGIAAATAMVPRPVLVLNPIIPTFETNPMTFSMMGALGSIAGALFGGGNEDTEDPVVAKLDQVIMAIQNMEINMDGQKVGTLTRLADTFRRG